VAIPFFGFLTRLALVFSTLLRGGGWTETVVGVEGTEGTGLLVADELASDGGISLTLGRDFIRRMYALFGGGSCARRCAAASNTRSTAGRFAPSLVGRSVLGSKLPTRARGFQDSSFVLPFLIAFFLS